MKLDPALLSSSAALLGALLGGGCSLLAAIHTQRAHDRIERTAAEVAKRESVYAEFVMTASNFLINAYTHDDIVLTGDEQRLLGLTNRMRFFAAPDIVAAAEAAVKSILEIALEPSVQLRQLAKEALAKSIDPDPILRFSTLCRADLDRLRGPLA